MYFNKMLGAFSFVLMLALVSINGSVIAATADGSTPANEGICDSLQGGTGGLYGLCVAYCEAQDLDSVDKEPPSTKILENYRKKMQPGDPDMPCIQKPCPCWSAEQLGSITNDGIAASCLRRAGSIQLIDVAPADHFAFADTSRTRCSYVDLNSSPARVTNQRISADDAQNCYTQLEQSCADLGL